VAEFLAHTVIRFTEQMLTEEHERVADTLHALNAVAFGQAMEAHPGRTTAV
jgi:hypothetical protein